MGFLKSLGRVVFDPANVTGAFGDSSPGPDPENGVPSVWNGPEGFAYGLPGKVADAISQHNADQRAKGFFESMSSGDAGAMGRAYKPGTHIAPPEFSAQWQYQPGQGPQWIEPQRDWSAGGQYKPVVNNGPAKGNRF